MRVKEAESESPHKIRELDPEILKKAEEGNSFAQLDIGKFYYSTSNQSNNVEDAFHWFKLSAEQGNMEAQFRLGDMYALGDGTEKKEFTAYDWYLKSAIQGYPKALTRLHNLCHTEKSMYCRGQRDSKESEWTAADFKKKNNIRELNEYREQQLESKLSMIQKYFTKLLSTCRELIDDDEIENKKDAYLKLGFLYQHGYGIRKIKNRAIEFYTLAAEKGNADAAYNLGRIYHHSFKMKWNYREAFKWYTKAAEKGHIYANDGLAFLYLKGLGTNSDYPKAIDLHTKAAESRNVNAMISLAKIFRKGEITTQDHEESAKWYTKAIMEDSTVAQSSLELLHVNENLPSIENDMYFKNKFPRVYSKKGLCSRLRSDISNVGESVNLEKLKRLATNAMKGDGHAMLEIGMKYYNGEDFIRDKGIAFKWIKNAAKTDIPTIQCTIAKMYRDGDCVEQDYHKASIWYEKAAKKGNVQARYNLGLMYHRGLGVRKDPLEASRWYTFAADKNNSNAQCQLGRLRENGEGLRRDLHEAFAWFSISAKQNNPQAVYKLAQMNENGAVENSSFKVALILYEKAAQLGSLDAQLRLADIYNKNESQYYNRESALKYYEMAANQGSPEAKYKLAIRYLDGNGVSKDLIKAYHLFKESSNLGYEKSISIIRNPIDYSKKSDIRSSDMRRMLELVCESGIDSLEYNLGCHYSIDKFEKAYLKEIWYQRAAAKNIPEAHYELAVIRERKNKLSKAVIHYEKAYSLGNIDATYKLACMYLDGHGVSQNFQKAFTLFNEASDRGHSEAYKVLNLFENGNPNIKHDLIQTMFEVSAQSGNIISQYKVGLLALERGKIEHYIQKAIKWLDKASKGGFIEASYRFALLLENAVEMQENYQEIIRLYQVAGDKGHKMALFRLAQLYHIGDKVEINYSKAYEFYALAAQQGYKPAQLAINITTESIWKENKIQLNHDLEILHLDYKSCFRMWEHISDDGKFDLQYKLGIIYEQNGGDSNIVQAAKWYSKAACSFHEDALYSLGRLYETGQGVDQDYTKAIEFYEKSSRLNNCQALYQLGAIYQEGRGVNSDLKAAHDYYKNAAKKGNSAAQFALGRFYEEGTFLQKNKLEAIKLYSISALQGNKDAEIWLITHYDEVYEDAFFYRRKINLLFRIVKRKPDTYYKNISLLAAANYELGKIYYYGYGTPINYKEAWKYFCKSSEIYGDSRAIDISAIKYENIDINIKDNYLKKLEMFEAVVDQLSVENVYELGSVYYHGVYSNSSDSQDSGTQVIVQSDHSKSSKYFRMIIKKDLSAGHLYMYCSYYLGMIYFVGIKYASDSLKAQNYLLNALNSGFSDAQPFLDYINATNADKDDEATLFKKAFECHVENQNTTCAKSIFNLGWMYDEGLGTRIDYKKAIHYYEVVARQSSTIPCIELDGEYSEGDEIKLKAVDQNQVIANYRLGDIFFNGKGVEKDYKLAFWYYKCAANQGHGNAQAQIGLLYTKGYGVGQNHATAMKWNTKAAHQKSSLGHYNLGNAYFYGEGVLKNYKLAFQYYQVAADLGHSDSQNSLGFCFENGYGVEQNYTTAIEWYTKAANQNHDFANYNLGVIYYEGQGVEKDYSLASQYFEVAANQRHSDAQNYLASMYRNGYGVEQNYTAAIEWFTKAAEQNNVSANYNLGIIYYYGEGVEKDYSLASQYFEIAADQRHSDAQNYLASMYGNGYGVEQNYTAAIEWFTKSANQNNVYANCTLGIIYYYGEGVENNYRRAFRYYKVAADQGHSDALVDLGIMYSQGLGIRTNYDMAASIFARVSSENNAMIKLGEMYHSINNQFQDFSKAFECYKNVREDDNNRSYALRGIGLLYEHGDSIEKNYEMAFDYYKQSAEKKNKGAYYNLALLYYYGKGVEKNYSVALEWFNRVTEEKPKITSTHVFVQVGSSIEADLPSGKRNKYSMVPESIIYGEAHYYLGLMHKQGQGTEVNYEKALNHFNIAQLHNIERAQEHTS